MSMPEPGDAGPEVVATRSVVEKYTGDPIVLAAKLLRVLRGHGDTDYAFILGHSCCVVFDRTFLVAMEIWVSVPSFPKNLRLEKPFCR